MLFILHDMLNMDIGWYLPAESLIEQVILRCRSKVLVTSYNVGDTHKVVVNDVCKVISRHTVCLYKYLVVEGRAVNSDIAVKLVMESNFALCRYFLSDNIRNTCVKLFLYLFR